MYVVTDEWNTHPGIVDTFKGVVMNGPDKNNTLEFPVPILCN